MEGGHACGTLNAGNYFDVAEDWPKGPHNVHACPAGTVGIRPTGAYASIEDCVPMPPGFYSAAGSEEPSACGRGSGIGGIQL